MLRLKWILHTSVAARKSLHWNTICSGLIGTESAFHYSTGGGTLVPSSNHAAREAILPINMTEAEVNDLFASCLPLLRRATRRMVRNRQDSEDALQDGLLLAFRNLHQFQGRSAFSTWLYRIVQNCSRLHYRKANAQRVAFADLKDADLDAFLIAHECIESRPSPEEMCIQQERSEILRRVTEELPPKYHHAIRCFHLEGLGEAESARRLSMTPSALKSRLHRSRRILTSKIRNSYMPESLKSFVFYRELPYCKPATRTRKCRAGRISASRKVENMMV